MITPNYYPNYYPQAQAQQPPQNSFVSVRSEDEARNYPVAVGNSISFKHENAPYIYTKTMGFSQFGKPIFEKYRLVKEPIEGEASAAAENPTIQALRQDIEYLKSEIEKMKGAQNVKSTNGTAVNAVNAESNGGGNAGIQHPAGLE